MAPSSASRKPESRNPASAVPPPGARVPLGLACDVHVPSIVLVREAGCGSEIRGLPDLGNWRNSLRNLEDRVRHPCIFNEFAGGTRRALVGGGFCFRGFSALVRCLLRSLRSPAPAPSAGSGAFFLPLGKLRLLTHMTGLYARWMDRWERKLATRDTNRVVRPFEWGTRMAAQPRLFPDFRPRPTAIGGVPVALSWRGAGAIPTASSPTNRCAITGSTREPPDLYQPGADALSREQHGARAVVSRRRRTAGAR